MSVPLLPNLGPIAVKAVANLVAAEAVNSASSGGGLLAGSHGVMMAVTQAKSHRTTPSNSGTPLAGTPGACGTPLSGAAEAQEGGAGSPRALAAAPGSPRGSGSPFALSSLGPSSGSRKLSSSISAASGSPRMSAAAAMAAAALHRRTVSGVGSSTGGAAATPTSGTAVAAAVGSTVGSDDSSSEDIEDAHDRFVAWMSSHEIQGDLESDDVSEYFPDALPDWDEATAAAADGAGAGAGAGGVQTPVRPGTPDVTPAGAAAGVLTAVGQQQSASQSAVAGAAAAAMSGQQQPQAQQALAPIRTTAPAGNFSAASGAGRGSTQGPGPTASFTSVPRVVLPGRAMMPAGIGDTVVPIFDGEPTSIAAYFLSSRAYQQQLNAAIRHILHEESKKVADEAKRAQEEAKKAATAAAASTAAALRQQMQQGAGGGAAEGAANSSGASANTVLPPVPVAHSRTRSQDAGAAALAAAEAGEVGSSSNASGQEHAAGTAADNSSGVAASGGAGTSAAQQSGSPRHQRNNSFGSSSGTSSTTAAWRAKLRQQQAAASRAAGGKQVQPDWLALLLCPEKLEVKHAFEDESPGMPWLRARFGVTAYFAPQFAELRRRCIIGGEAAFITSLCRCRKWASRGGKSNAYFAKTRDDRFIIKGLSKPEKVSAAEPSIAVAVQTHHTRGCLGVLHLQQPAATLHSTRMLHQPVASECCTWLWALKAAQAPSYRPQICTR